MNIIDIGTLVLRYISIIRIEFEKLSTAKKRTLRELI
jgi:hypothetical protein